MDPQGFPRHVRRVRLVRWRAGGCQLPPMTCGDVGQATRPAAAPAVRAAAVEVVRWGGRRIARAGARRNFRPGAGRCVRGSPLVPGIGRLVVHSSDHSRARTAGDPLGFCGGRVVCQVRTVADRGAGSVARYGGQLMDRSGDRAMVRSGVRPIVERGVLMVRPTDHLAVRPIDHSVVSRDGRFVGCPNGRSVVYRQAGPTVPPADRSFFGACSTAARGDGATVRRGVRPSSEDLGGVGSSRAGVGCGLERFGRGMGRAGLFGRVEVRPRGRVRCDARSIACAPQWIRGTNHGEGLRK